jgi:alkylation response protein AidB-like acyl-CoA dehydrogenase
VNELREEVRTFVRDQWSEDITVREWWRRLADARLAMPTWRAPYGRALSSANARIVTEELAAGGVIAPAQGHVATRLAGPTLLAHGTDEQCDAFVPPLLRGEESWCQLFSEPGAGSDLPSLSTKAIRDGDEWVLNGQKVWNSGADLARRGLVLARTDPERAKRDGITFFLIDMKQIGVEPRPLKTMNGLTQFCEVFLTDARVDADAVVGEVNRGWIIARTTLGYERASANERPARGLVYVPSGEAAGHLDRCVGEVLAELRPTSTRTTRSAVPTKQMITLAREQSRAHDPHIRDGLVRYFMLTEVYRLTQQRAAANAKQGRPGAESSISKLALGRICNASRDLSFTIMGAGAMLNGPDAPYGGELHTVGLSSPGVTIGAGTDEIQRNTIAERILGLPREPSTD